MFFCELIASGKKAGREMEKTADFKKFLLKKNGGCGKFSAGHQCFENPTIFILNGGI